MARYFITGNKGKFEEIKEHIPSLQQLDIDLPEIQDIDPKAIIKAKLLEAFKHRQGEFIVEDTSLSLECLGGLPGPFIKWFLKTMGTDGIADLANRLGSNKAEATCLIGYAKSLQNIHYFEGRIKGTIISPQGDNGFGWDPIFLPEGTSQAFAQMSKEEKNAISHRSIATQALKTFIHTST